MGFAYALVSGGFAVTVLFPVLNYTLGEYEIAWLAAACFGFGILIAGLWRLDLRPAVIAAAALALVTTGYLCGTLINRIVVDAFAWPHQAK